jgi:hypothetical protein
MASENAAEDVVFVSSATPGWAPGKERPPGFTYKKHPEGGVFVPPPGDKYGKSAPEWEDVGLISQKTVDKSYVWLCHWCDKPFTGIPGRIKFHLGQVRLLFSKYFLLAFFT